MGTKFGRNYSLSIQGTDGYITVVEPPFTMEFDITRNTLTSANVCQVRIYNLALERRNNIRRNYNDFGPPFQAIELKAGYGDQLTTIFSGNITQAWSVREGTNFITQIECFDGGFAFVTGQTSQSFPAGTPQAAIISALYKDLPHVKPGAIGGFDEILKRGAAYVGNTMTLLRENTGGGTFIDNGKVYSLKDNEFVDDGSTTLISPRTGLLATPVLERSIARVDMIFEPKLNIGRQVLVDSFSDAHFNGIYKVVEVKHRGVISGAVAGRVTTTAAFFFTKTSIPVLGL